MRTWMTVLLLLPLAGCLGGDTDGPTTTPPATPDMVRDPDWAVDALPLDHDHGDPALHQGLSSANWNTVGWDPLATDYHGAPSGGYYCGEVTPDGERRLAVVNSFTSNTAIVIVDVTDPLEPMLVGELVLENAHVYDSAITDDGAYALLATSPLITENDPNDPTRERSDGRDGAAGSLDGLDATTEADAWTTRATWTDACGDVAEGPLDVLPVVSGTVLVDLSDPSAPTIADYQPRPAIGPHSVWSGTIDDTRWVIASTTNLAYDGSVFSFFTVEDTPAGGRLVEYGEHSSSYAQDDVPTNTNELPLLNGHVDASLSKHPVTGELIAYLANWDAGLRVVRLDGPGLIVPLATWGAIEAGAGSGMTGAIHSALPLAETWHDRAIVITGQELGGRPSDRPTGQIVFLDVTDPATPTPIARWTLPVDIQWSGGLTFSTHYIALQDDVLYTALYHGGVWAADADPEHWPELPSLGVFMPDRNEEAGEPATCSLTPEVLDVLALGEGRVLMFDSCTGAYVAELEQGGDVPMAAPWMDDAWI